MSFPDADDGAFLNSSSVALLSQRDVSNTIPFNYDTAPGVAITAACFPNGVYDDAAGSKCISNLLAMGFRRLDIDVYWDASRQSWSLCPVELGGNSSLLSTSTSVAPSPATTLEGSSLLGRTAVATHFPTPRLDAGQFSVPQTPSFIPTFITPRTLARTTPPVNASIDSVLDDEPAINVGPYTCSPSLNLLRFNDILSDYLYSTETNLNATSLIITGNIHAAASASDPTGSAQQPPSDLLPQQNQLFGDILTVNTSTYLFTPASLSDGRSNLRASRGWFSVGSENQPNADYFHITNNDGDISTPDGWPSQSLIEDARIQRLLIEYGRVDPQMAAYNFSAESSTIFSSGYLQSAQNVTFQSNGEISSGCFYNPANTTLGSRNSSWALFSLGSGGATPASALSPLFTEARTLTACGISAFLNSTLNNATADANYTAYKQFIQQTIWSWAPGQPISSTTNASVSAYQCAALNATSGYWQAAACNSSYPAACRNPSEPYMWSVSTAADTYQNVSTHCPTNTSFDVPRAALENRYLVAAWRNHLASSSSSSSSRRAAAKSQVVRTVDNDNDGNADELLWLDLNDLDFDLCWVIGPTSSCPYVQPADVGKRAVTVPAVAALIVFILLAFTVLVKCAGNRQSAKRKWRRGDDGWDYEGVPS